MFQHQGIWLPDGEKHFPQWMSRNGELVDGKGTYQIKKWRACSPFIKDWRVAIDVGAHVGLWAMQLAKSFDEVHAFEPVPAFRDCFAMNLVERESKADVILRDHALGAVRGQVRMAIDPADTGGTHVDASAESGDVELHPLDALGFQTVDFLKIDCEGYELQVLQGAVETLKRCRPCVIVEQKPHKLLPNFGIKGTPAVDFLRELGAHMRTVISGDYIMSWDRD